MKKNVDLSIFITRIAIGFPMLVYGVSKLFFGIDFIKNVLAEHGLPPVLGYGVYVGEVIAPVLLIVGFRTRLAALIFAINCLTAIVLVQSSNFFKMNASGGWASELLVIYLLVGTSFYFTGGGKFALSTENKWD